MTEHTISTLARQGHLRPIGPANPPSPPPSQRLSEYSQPSLAELPQVVIPPGLEGVEFEIKPQFISMIERKQFGGNRNEDPNRHYQDFCQYCSTIRQKGVTQDQIREILFPFSLCDKAKTWFNGLDRTANNVTDWNSLALAFYKKYYPPEKTALMRSALMNFSQERDETLYEAWERFKDLQR